MRDTPERDLAVAQELNKMADNRVVELESRNARLQAACEAALSLINDEYSQLLIPRRYRVRDQLEHALNN